MAQICTRTRAGSLVKRKCAAAGEIFAAKAGIHSIGFGCEVATEQALNQWTTVGLYRLASFVGDFAGIVAVKRIHNGTG